MLDKLYDHITQLIFISLLVFTCVQVPLHDIINAINRKCVSYDSFTKSHEGVKDYAPQAGSQKKTTFYNQNPKSSLRCTGDKVHFKYSTYFIAQLKKTKTGEGYHVPS